MEMETELRTCQFLIQAPMMYQGVVRAVRPLLCLYRFIEQFGVLVLPFLDSSACCPFHREVPENKAPGRRLLEVFIPWY
jgi:hypothetical protein